MKVHPIYRIPHPDGHQSVEWWRKVESFLNEELSAAGAEAWSDGFADALSRCSAAVVGVGEGSSSGGDE